MAKEKIITIAGTLGSGKSSTADLVAKELGYKRFSSGDFMRKIALEMGISLNELSLKAQEHPEIDEKIDREVKKAGEGEKIVIDSRLGFYWLPDSFRVFLKLPPEIAKERILHDLKRNPLRRKSEHSKTGEEIYQKIIARRESEKKRYKELYDIDDLEDPNNYDLVIDTNKNNLAEVAAVVLKEYKNWLAD